MNTKNSIFETLNEFMEEFDPTTNTFPGFCGGAIGIPSNEKNNGIILYFETKKALNSFPFKEKTYKGYPVTKIVVGKIKPL